MWLFTIQGVLEPDYVGGCMARVNFEYINTQCMLNCRISDFTESTKKWPNFFSVILNNEKVINVQKRF